MRLLVTNDDGIESTFLDALVRALQHGGHDLVVVAPAHEQSWIGAAKSRWKPLQVVAVARSWECPTWTVSGTPSDCVNLALGHLLPKGWRPDAVVSGINVGVNASLPFILASGTIGGAWEGAAHGLPAFAFSQSLSPDAYSHVHTVGGEPPIEVLNTLATSATEANRLVSEFGPTTGAHQFIVHNFNFPYPHHSPAPVRATNPALSVPGCLYAPTEQPDEYAFVYQLGEAHARTGTAGQTDDRSVLAAGETSHTILDYTQLGVAPRE